MSRAPAALAALAEACERLGFEQSSDPPTGALLRSLAAAKPDGRLLELGTGVGMSTAWLLDGMTAGSTLLTVDNATAQLAVVERVLGGDPRLTVVDADGGEVLADLGRAGERFDLIFADTWPGKYTHLEQALGLLAGGGFYVVDDLLPQPTWPDGHASAVEELRGELRGRAELVVAELDWSTGVLVATRRGGPG